MSSWRPFPKGGSGCGRESAGTNVWARATRTRVLVVVAVAVAATFRFITRTQRGSVRGVGHGARRIFREVREGDFRAVRGRIGARERVVGRATVRRPAVESGSSVVVRVHVPSVRGLAITARIIRATVLFVPLPVAAEPPAVRAVSVAVAVAVRETTVIIVLIDDCISVVVAGVAAPVHTAVGNRVKGGGRFVNLDHEVLARAARVDADGTPGVPTVQIVVVIRAGSVHRVIVATGNVEGIRGRPRLAHRGAREVPKRRSALQQQTHDDRARPCHARSVICGRRGRARDQSGHTFQRRARRLLAHLPR